MNYDFVVLGANGTQGKIAARDLLESGYSVLLCANDDYGLDNLIDYEKADFALFNLEKVDPKKIAVRSDEVKNLSSLKRILKKSGAKVVVNCMIDDFNLPVSELCLELGTNYLDLDSEDWVTREQFKHSRKYEEKGLIGITGAGSTPGITNVMLRYVRPEFDTIEEVKVGFAWKSNMDEFVIPFSLDAIDAEFKREATVLENGKFVKRRPEECNEEFDYFQIGKQKTFYTDHIEHNTFYEYLKDAGIKNIHVYSSFPEYSYNTLKKLIKLGFTSKETLELGNKKVRPLDCATEVLRRSPVPENYKEKENLWLKVYGTKDGKETAIEMDAIAETLPGWEEATCNIDTGMPASIIAQMIFDGRIRECGFFSPEFVVPAGVFFEELAARKIWIYKNRKKVNPLGIHNQKVKLLYSKRNIKVRTIAV